MNEERKRITEEILRLLEERGEGKTICPSEAVRRLYPDDWRDRMELCREAAAELADSGRIEIHQGGKTVDPRSHRGPTRLALPGE